MFLWELEKGPAAIFPDRVEKEPRRQETTLSEYSVPRIDLRRIGLRSLYQDRTDGGSFGNKK